MSDNRHNRAGKYFVTAYTNLEVEAWLKELGIKYRHSEPTYITTEPIGYEQMMHLRELSRHITYKAIHDTR